MDKNPRKIVYPSALLIIAATLIIAWSGPIEKNENKDLNVDSCESGGVIPQPDSAIIAVKHDDKNKVIAEIKNLNRCGASTKQKPFLIADYLNSSNQRRLELGCDYLETSSGETAKCELNISKSDINSTSDIRFTLRSGEIIRDEYICKEFKNGSC